MSESLPFNPLDTKNLAVSVAEALLGRKPRSLVTLTSFSGAGIYAIYYDGTFPAYEPLVKRNMVSQFAAPIYVGKAIPQGARTGRTGSEGGVSKALFGRLKEHAESINTAKNLKLADFTCRFLNVEDIWIPLGESLLISKFSPLWNSIIDGFGNHDPGKGRYMGMRPRWDVLHPGRAWAERCQPRAETTDQIRADVSQFLRTMPEPPVQTLYAEFRKPPYAIK